MAALVGAGGAAVLARYWDAVSIVSVTILVLSALVLAMNLKSQQT